MRHIDLSFSSIVNSALNEDITKVRKQYGSDLNGKINKAIDTMHYLYLNYDDRKGDKFTKIDPATGQPRWGNPRNYRIVLPFAYYESNQSGEPTLRALHWSNMHTKRGPGKWKEFKLSGIKNARILRATFSMDDIPGNANFDGDAHASEIYNIVGRSPGEYQDKFLSPLEREKARMDREKKGFSSDDLYINQQGAVDTSKTAVPQVKKGRNLKTMQNLGKPGNVDYKKAYDAVKQSDARKTFRDWDKAEAERRDQQSQQQRPMNPPQNNAGPVNTRQQNINNDEEENWDEYLNRPNNNNF